MGKMERYLILALFMFQLAVAQQSSQQWKTLSGDTPAVIARGGYSGLFPDSSDLSYDFASAISLPGAILFCDLQLTKDNVGICQGDLRLDNSTNIATVYPKGDNTYTVNGNKLHGWFTNDFTTKQLFSKVTLTQSIFTRPSVFDNSVPMLTLQDVGGRRVRLWVNVQYDSFFKQQNLSAATYIQSATMSMVIDFISSPEVAFLQNIKGLVPAGKTKLIFRFMEADDVEPTTNKTYGSILADLSSVKAFASGILVPKSYIWPVKDGYLQPATSLVNDAHKVGLAVYAYGFANDAPASYNYSYDPIREYVQFVSNGDFSVDGVLTDFPSTASEAIGCIGVNNTATESEKPLVITHNGASGVFAGCTDLAYEQAVKDGADVIDCAVQMTKDGIPVCLRNIDLMVGTTAMNAFASRARSIPQIQESRGIFSIDLTWAEIQTLSAVLSSQIETETGLRRNPAYKNQGKFMTLADFLAFAKEKSVSGVLLDIQNAVFLANNGFDISDAVISALSNASYDKQTAQKVFIQSDDSSVLKKFKQQTSYKGVYNIEKVISDASTPALDDIKQFAEAVNVARPSLVISSAFFVTGFTDVVEKMHAKNISVYVSVLRNEYVSLAFDFLSDPSVELATFARELKVDGLVTEFPATASNYLRSGCFKPDKNTQYTILSIQPNNLLSSVSASDGLPPAEAPAPVLSVSDVSEPPLPPVSIVSHESPAAAPEKSSLPSGHPAFGVNIVLSLIMMALSIVSLNI
ncbi:glycerophosphodiester phosphodiesterase GDPDL7-like [Nymphaea colorata]|nr:glycerophosphodiester phosphodiesterase GDPDL7-like [Nymphaea colorata]